MGRIVTIKNSFNTGEISPYTLARTDLDKYKNACESLQNFIPLITGGITRRPGTRYVYQALGPSRLIPFVYNSGQSFILEFGNLQLRFFTISGGVPGVITSGGSPYVVTTPYNTASDDLWDLKFAQQGDVMYITHPNHPVMKLSRVTNTNWTLIQPTFSSPPLYAQDQDVGTDKSATLTPGATTGSGIAFTASNPVFIQGDIGKFIVSGAGLGLITALAGSTTTDGVTGATLYPQATVKIVDAFASTAAIAAGSWLLRGPPQSYAGFGGVSGGNWIASRKLGAGGGQLVYTWDSFIKDGGAVGTLSQDTFRAIDLNRYIVLGGAVGQIVSVVTAGEVIVQVYSAIEDTYTDANGNVIALMQSGGVWSILDQAFTAGNGYPNAVLFMQDRLLFAGTAAQPLQIWGSRTGDYENFAKGPQDNDGLDLGINAATQQPIRALIEFRGNLGCFTAREEYMVGGGIVQISANSPQALTPGNVTAVKQSQNGAARVQPLVVQNMLIYIWRSKYSASEMSYNIYQANFGSRNLNILHELITTSGFKEMYYQQYPYFALWFTTLDNQLVGLTYEVEQQVWGWHRHFTGQDLSSPDGVVSVCPIPNPTNEQDDNLWICTKRTVNGSTVYSIEIFDSTLNTDAASQTTFGGKVTSVSGLGYLQGRTVQLKADGMYIGTFVVPSSGIVDFHTVWPEGGYDIEVGLPYTSYALTVRPEMGGPGQTVQGLRKQWNKVWLRVYNTINLLLGAGPSIQTNPPKPTRLLGRRPSDPLGVAPALFTGDVPLEGNLGADFDGRILIEQDQPFPMTVLAPFGIVTLGDQ